VLMWTIILLKRITIVIQKHRLLPTEKATGFSGVEKNQRIRRRKRRIPTEYGISDGNFSVGIRRKFRRKFCGSRGDYRPRAFKFRGGVCFAGDWNFRERRGSWKRMRRKREKVKLEGLIVVKIIGKLILFWICYLKLK